MANRRTHKKLRAEVLSRMRTTGESYQQALVRLLSVRTAAKAPRTDLVPFSYFGIQATLATIEMHGVTVVVVVPSSKLWGRGYPHPFPLPLVRGLMRTQGVQ